MKTKDLLQKLESIPLIKENDGRLKLGILGNPPKVECRVISEDLFQEIIYYIKKSNVVYLEQLIK